MTDERYKQIMSDLGMPNSRSLLMALQQVANEVAQDGGKGWAQKECKPHTEAEVQELLTLVSGAFPGEDDEKIIRLILGVPAP